MPLVVLTFVPLRLFTTPSELDTLSAAAQSAKLKLGYVFRQRRRRVGRGALNRNDVEIGHGDLKGKLRMERRGERGGKSILDVLGDGLRRGGRIDRKTQIKR